MGAIIFILVGIVWWWRFSQPPADSVLKLLLGVFLVYAWYSAGKTSATRSPWELGAGITLVAAALAEFSGLLAGGLDVVGTPQFLIGVTGLVYRLDRRAPGRARRGLIGLLFLAGGILWSVGHASGRLPSDEPSTGWILGLAGLVVLFLWWSHRQEDQTSPWQFGVGVGMLVAGLGLYATGGTTNLVPLMLIGTGVGDVVVRQTERRREGI